MWRGMHLKFELSSVMEQEEGYVKGGDILKFASVVFNASWIYASEAVYNGV